MDAAAAASSSAHAAAAAAGAGGGEEEYTRGSYFHAKEKKLDQQFEQSRNTESSIFQGVHVAVDGYTDGLTALEIRQILARHGGKYAHYVWTPGITHLITSNLPTAKLRKELTVKRRTPLAIVTPQWIVDCLKAKRQLPCGDYALAQLHAPDQTTLNSWRSKLPPLGSSSEAAAAQKLDELEVIDPVVSHKQILIRLREEPAILGLKSLLREESRDSPVVLYTEAGGHFRVVSLSRTIKLSQLAKGALLDDSLSSKLRNRLSENNDTEASESELCLQGVQLEIGHGSYTFFYEYFPSFAESFLDEFCRSLKETFDVSDRIELLNSTEALVQLNCDDPFHNVTLAEAISESLGIKDAVTIYQLDSPIKAWTQRIMSEDKSEELFSKLACVNFRVSAKIGRHLPIPDAAIRILEVADTKEEHVLRRVCTGQVWRGVGHLPGTQPDDASIFAQVLNPKRRGSADQVTDIVVKRLQSRVDYRTILDYPCLVLKFATPTLKRSSVISASNLYNEVLDMVKQVVEGPLPVEVLSVEIQPSPLPRSYSQISPKVLKQLPRDVVRDLKLQYGRSLTKSSSEDRNDDEKPFAARTSQVDPSILNELPEDLQNEIRQNMAKKTTPQDVKLKPAFPTSASQIDEDVFAELPPEIQQSIERNLGRKKRKKVTMDILDKPIFEQVNRTSRDLFDLEGDGFVEDSASRSSFPETFSQIDMATLRELPKDVADQIEREFKLREGRERSKSGKPTLDRFIQKPSNQGRAISKEPGEASLAFEPFSSVTESIVHYMATFERTCPHQDDAFAKSVIAYSKALMQCMELDKLVMLLGFLRRACCERSCGSHGSESNCWRLVYGDLERRVSRAHQDMFDGVKLALNVYW